MKKVALVLGVISLMISSCGGEKKVVKQDVKPEFNIQMDSLEHRGQKYEFNNFNLDSVLNTKELIKNMADKALFYTYFETNYPETIKFKKVSFYEWGVDTALVSIDYTAENAYGVPGKITTNVPIIISKNKVIEDNIYSAEN